MDTGWEDAADPAGGEWTGGEWSDSHAAPATEAGGDEWGASDDGGEDGTIKLGQSPNAQNLRDALLALPDLGQARVDASEIERLPGPVFQVLLIAMRDALCAGGRIRVVNPSFAFGLCFEAFGLGGDLEPFEAEYV